VAESFRVALKGWRGEVCTWPDDGRPFRCYKVVDPRSNLDRPRYALRNQEISISNSTGVSTFLLRTDLCQSHLAASAKYRTIAYPDGAPPPLLRFRGQPLLNRKIAPPTAAACFDACPTGTLDKGIQAASPRHVPLLHRMRDVGPRNA
jgi:hypothetical protein